MKLNKNIWLMPLLFLAGCAGMGTKPFPAVTGPVKISFFTEKSNSRRYVADWPVGTYRVPNTNVFIADQQGDENLSPAELEANLAGKNTVVGEGDTSVLMSDLAPSLGLDTEDMARKTLKDTLAQGKGEDRYRLAEEGEEGSLKIFPYLVFSHVDKGKSRLWVVLKAYYGGDDRDHAEWKCRYVTSLGLARTFLGENGWTGQGGKLLQHAAEWDMRTTLQVMLKDLEGKLRTENPPRQKVNGCWAFYHKALSVDAQILSKGPDKFIVLPLVGDTEYFSGINILPDDFTESELADPHALLK